jgi:hypothetical protein
VSAATFIVTLQQNWAGRNILIESTFAKLLKNLKHYHPQQIFASCLINSVRAFSGESIALIISELQKKNRLVPPIFMNLQNCEFSIKQLKLPMSFIF